ncbi:MAG: CDP-alcohol phosphatidyltransferase family protein [Chloroflexota bacterium]
MRNQSFVAASTRARIRGWAVPIALAMGRVGLTPNGLTIIGFLGTCAAAVAAGLQSWVAAGVLVIAFGIFDLFDGALARATGRASKFGAFLDSTLDRTGESIVLAGVAVGFAAAGIVEGVALATFAAGFASSVTYTRAKAEALGLQGEVGVAPRPERLVILTAGLILGGLFGVESVHTILASGPGGSQVGPGSPSGGAVVLLVALGLIAILSAITVVQRILHVRRQLDAQQQESK